MLKIPASTGSVTAVPYDGATGNSPIVTAHAPAHRMAVRGFERRRFELSLKRLEDDPVAHDVLDVVGCHRDQAEGEIPPVIARMKSGQPARRFCGDGHAYAWSPLSYDESGTPAA